MKHGVDLAAKRNAIKRDQRALGAASGKCGNRHHSRMGQHRRFKRFESGENRQRALCLSLLEEKPAQERQCIAFCIG